MEARARVRVVVRGRVQGVGFRYFVVREARWRGIVGWVRNRSDGAVELEAEGEAEALEGFVEALREGPALARVDAVERVAVGVRGTDEQFGVEA